MELNFPKLEEKTLKFWKENRTFERSINQRRKAPDFVFYEGPPTANAKPGIHHVLSRVYKDIICRYKTMRGFRVLRKAGWDTHGLPVELEIEKKLGLKSKKDIEKYGIAEFNEKCRNSVWLYQQDWEKLTERIGFWLDTDHPYVTYQPDYIESVWWILKKIYRKGLIYRDYKVIPYCPRCQTGLSSHEVALGYKKVREGAIYVKFEVKDRGGLPTYFLVWTTTPWTLPGNAAIAVNPKLTYEKVKVGKEFFIVAKDRKEACLPDTERVESFKGEKLLGLEYRPLFEADSGSRNIYCVVAGDFVSSGEGTGLVHIAPAFGEDDLAVGKKNKLPVINTVAEDGKMKTPGFRWDGIFAKEADPLIVENLKAAGSLLKEEMHEHDYPFCWRCGSPLLYYAKQSWFISVRKVKRDLIKGNRRVNWVPAHLKEGRFGEWLREVKDWAFSRERYWGTPIPIWQCGECGRREVVGSRKDLLKQDFTTNRYYILRHGQTPYQTKKKEIMYPPQDKDSVPLTAVGEKEVKKAARDLKDKKIDLIYASDLFRTRRTAALVAEKTGAKIVFDKRLRDVNLGVYSGGRKEDFYERFPGRADRFYDGKPLRGESWGECRKRMADFVYEIDRKHQNKTILIVSHGDPLWLLEGMMRGWTDEELIEKKIKKLLIHTAEWRKLDFKRLPLDGRGRVDFHRPHIDQVRFQCPGCGAIMERVPEVADCWLDAGSMPFAQYHYPFQNKGLIDKRRQFPAEYISEAVDQTRGWFYTLLAVSTLLGFGPAYKNVISLGHVLDEKGEKMSKSKGNVVDPRSIIDRYGADSVRWYLYTANQPGDAKLFSEKDIDLALKKFVMTLWNSFRFFKTYAPKSIPKVRSGNLLDRWILSRANETAEETSRRLDHYDVTGAARSVENFVVNDLSLWYIRRSRRRFQKPADRKELKEASATLDVVFRLLSRMAAPFVPFLSEEIYRELAGSSKSVHLEDWPPADKKLVDKELNKKMERAREIVKSALAARAKAGIKVRQPLSNLQIKEKMDKGLLELIKEEVNVKRVTFGKSLRLDTRITAELREEGVVREVLRYIQEMRKTAGFKPGDRVSIRYSGEKETAGILSRHKDFILRETRAKDFAEGKRPKQAYKSERETKISGRPLWLGIKKA